MTRRGGVLVRTVVTVFACLLLIAGAVGAVRYINSTEPVAQQEGATRKTAALVETIRVDRGTYTPKLEVLGVVEPAREVLLSPRITGMIVSIQPAFQPGGIVEAGQALLKIDPADFEQTLTLRRSELEQAQAELAIEEGRREVARREFELLGEGLDDANSALVLREPQIRSIRARVQAAEAAVEQARLELERTTVPAPFDAKILTQSANVGSQVSPGDALGRLVGTDEYWIMASVPLRQLQWIEFPEAEHEGARASVRHTTAWPDGVSRQGRVSRLIGNVDERSRLAQVLITVADPLARETDGPPLILRTIVQVRIDATPLVDVVQLDRAYLRQDDTVWVMSDNTLDIRDVEVVFTDADHAYISGGLEPGEAVVTTSLATVTPGLPLRREGDPVEDEQPADEAAPGAQAAGGVSP